MKILIADDDLLSRKMLAAVTEKWRYEPVIAKEGQEAARLLELESAPQLLLIDWEMPYMNGLELCHLIRKKDTNTPAFIILLTGRSEVDDIVQGLDAGANDYIVKPFSNAELKARMDAGRRMLELQEKLHNTQEILNHERRVIENVLVKMREAQPFDGDNLNILEQPVEKASGDILLSAFKHDGTQHILLGDFTGHGLTAAVAGPIVFDSFYGMTKANQPLAKIIRHINKKLVRQIPVGLFLATIFIEIDANQQTVSLWNCGMSDILIYRQQKLIHRVAANFFALGVIDKEVNAISGIEIHKNDKIFAYSDGITECMNIDNQEFGQARFEQAITRYLASSFEIDFFKDQLDQYRGVVKALDDITLIEVVI